MADLPDISGFDLKSLREHQSANHQRYGQEQESARKTLIETLEREAATLGFDSNQELIDGYLQPATLQPPTLRRGRKANDTKHRKNGPGPSASNAESTNADSS